MDATYDRIGGDYAATRRPDPRIAAAVERALGNADIVLNVGAGTGAYEPEDRRTVAVEPSITMIRQRRSRGSALAVQGRAEALPFADRRFDAAMALLTIHHWTDPVRGLQDMRRVTRGRIVLLTFDPASRGTWLTDYLPGLIALDAAQLPAMSFYGEYLGKVDILPVPIPHDCTDGFLYAFWRRPSAYLNPARRAGSSSFWALPNVDAAMWRLEDDLKSGVWTRRYGHLLKEEVFDAGYRLVVTAR